MNELLITVLPMNLATIIMSPLVLAFSLIALGSTSRSLKKASFLFLGVVVVAIVMVLLGIGIGYIGSNSSQPSLYSAVINLIVGVFFLIYVIKVALDKNYGIKQDIGEAVSLKGLFILGFVLEITNFGAMLLSFHAAQYVAAANINVAGKLVLWIVNVLCFSLPAWLPILFYIAFKTVAIRAFGKLNQFISKHIRLIVIIVFGIFAILFIKNGIAYFL